MREFYEEIGEDFIKSQGFYTFLYSFSTSKQNFLLKESNLKDINGANIQKIEPQIR